MANLDKYKSNIHGSLLFLVHLKITYMLFSSVLKTIIIKTTEPVSELAFAMC